MNKLLLILGGIVGVAVLFVGGIALGDVLTDDAEPSTAVAGPSATKVPAATLVPIDPGATPDLAVGTDPDAPTPPPTWPAASTHQLVDSPSDPSADEELAAIYDPETGIDSDGAGEPWVSPTSPAFDPETGDPDSDAAPVVEDGVAALTEDEVEDLFVPHGVDFLFRFVDDCAGGAPGSAAASGDAADESDCPDGTGGTIALTGGGTTPAPLQIMRQMYTSIGVPLELRCSPLGFSADGTHRAIFASNNPADFTIRYWLSSEPADVNVVEWSTPEAESELWLERRVAGEPTSANMHQGVHNCPEIPGLVPGRSATFEIHGVDDAGTEADARFSFTPSPGAGGSSLGRPHASFTPLDRDGRGVLAVPYDERTEQVYVAALPRAGRGATAESCTDVENAVLARARSRDASLINTEITAFPRTEGDGFEPGIESSVVAQFAGEEGTAYDLCIWVTRPPRASFDKPPVVMREVVTVRTPARWRTRILLGGGHSDVDLDAQSISVQPVNWPSIINAPRWPDEPVRAGAFYLDEMVVLRDGGSVPIPPHTNLRVTGPTGATADVVLPTPTSCAIFLCVREGFEQYDIAIPGPRSGSRICGSGFGACDPPTTEEALGNLRIVVETYAGPGGPPSTNLLESPWDIAPQTSFAGTEAAALPATPQIDFNSLVFQSYGGTAGIHGGRPGLQASVGFDRPVMVTVTPRGTECGEALAPQSTAAPTTRIDMRFENRCWGATYGLDLIAVDADGNIFDARTQVDGVPTGRPYLAFASMPKVRVAEYSARFTFNQIGEGYGVTYADLGPMEVVARGTGTHCVAADDPVEKTVRNVGGYPIMLSDPVGWSLELIQRGGGGECGDDSHRESMTLEPVEGQPTLEQLAAGPVTLHFTHEDGTDVVVEIFDVVFE